MIEHSEELNELATALATAQGRIADAEKRSDNPFFKSKYADLAEVLGQIRPIFSEVGLSITQFPCHGENEMVGLSTMLMHSSGQWLQSTLSIPVQDAKNVAQTSGSVITYMRRYAAAAVAGIAQVDDDGNRKEPDKPFYNNVEADAAGLIGELEGGRSVESLIAMLETKYRIKDDVKAQIRALNNRRTGMDKIEAEGNGGNVLESK